MSEVRKKARPSRQFLVFVDSNIFLDFYRADKEAALKLLERLTVLPPNTVITNYQVEAEVLRNRQKVMLLFFEALNGCATRFTAPAFISDCTTTLMELVVAAREEAERVKTKLLTAIENPESDPVLRILERLFSSQSKVNLRRDNKIRKQIKRRALSRFQLGYPPRKPGDTSMGDAFNWEWIVECVTQQKKDVILVSRDTDYGTTVGGKSHLNHCLAQEIRERASPRRRVTLVDRLSKGLALLDVEVTKEEATQEEVMVASAPQSPSGQTLDKIADALLAHKPAWANAMAGSLPDSIVRWWGQPLPKVDLDDATLEALKNVFKPVAVPSATGKVKPRG